MNERLKAAASSGDIKSLYSIIGDDAYVLDRTNKGYFYVLTIIHIKI